MHPATPRRAFDWRTGSDALRSNIAGICRLRARSAEGDTCRMTGSQWEVASGEVAAVLRRAESHDRAVLWKETVVERFSAVGAAVDRVLE